MTVVETISFPSLIALGNALLLPHISLSASNDTQQTLPVTDRHATSPLLTFAFPPLPPAYHILR
jgi:hypothetical protein